MTPNPVERQIAALCGQWASFLSDNSRRCLVWRAPDNASRILECFFEIQKHDTGYSTGDFFLVFNAPFENSARYSRHLKKALANRNVADNKDHAAEWKLEEAPDSAAGFAACINSFNSAHQGTIKHSVPVFMPTSVADVKAFTEWIIKVLNQNIHENIRYLVIDSIETPFFQAGKGAHISVETLDIDPISLARETFANENGTGPAAIFRNHLIDTAALMEKGSTDQVKSKALDALAFARQHGWADQEVVLGIMIAGALLKEKRFDEAADAYQEARQAAGSAGASGNPSVEQLVLQTWFGEAGVHFAAGDMEKALHCYDQAAVTAEKIPVPVLAIEALRMGSFCLAQINYPDSAKAKLKSALLTGKDIDMSQREKTTLPLTVVDLLRLTGQGEAKRMEEIKDKLEKDIVESRQSFEERIANEENNSIIRAEEEGLAISVQKTEEQAESELATLVSQSSEEFRSVFAEGRELLGPGFPLFTDIALPRAKEVNPL